MELKIKERYNVDRQSTFSVRKTSEEVVLEEGGREREREERERDRDRDRERHSTMY